MSVNKPDNETKAERSEALLSEVMHLAPDTQFRWQLLTKLLIIKTVEGQRRAVNF